MAEWGIPFDHIEAHWTDAQLMIMWRRLVERKEAERDAVENTHGGKKAGYGD